MKATTINDVAALAGVSLKTVSRVLNHEPHVREATRDKVLKAVAELNFRPNTAARALAGSRAYILGLYYDNTTTADYISAVQMGAMAACREAGYHLVVDKFEPAGPESIAADVQALLAGVHVDGVILTPPVCDRVEVLDALDARRTPYVRIAPATDVDRSPYVFMDDRQAAFDMTRHLQGLGHRRIGFVKGHADHLASALRLQGYIEAMAAAGLEVAPEWIQPGNFSFRSGFGAGERLLNLSPRPTAVFAANDDMALGVMAVANRMNLAIPERLSLAGFDDSPIAGVIWPQLTTIRQPATQMAMEAAKLLIRGGGGEGHRMDFTLMVRGSTAPVSPQD